MRRSLCIVLIALWGCSSDEFVSQPVTEAGLLEAGGVDPAVDHDKDGYTPAQGDCDDADPTVHPGAKEVCKDGKDNNCNGTTDDLEPDADGDGFGPCQGDCDDANKAISPAAKELPDGIDNNCDGVVDADYDGDGVTVAQGDCDDADPEVSPKAAELCFDGKDNNCNTFVDDKEPDADKDGYGPCGGDCDDTNPLVNPGAKEIAGDGIDNNCDYMIDADTDGDGWTTANGDCNDADPAIISPGSQSQVGPSFQVAVTAQDDVKVSRVEFFVDGNLLDNRIDAPYTFNVSNLTAGSHNIRAEALDSAGQRTSTIVTVQVGTSQQPDPQQPDPQQPTGPTQPSTPNADPENTLVVGACNMGAPIGSPGGAPWIIVVGLLVVLRRSRPV